MHSICIVDSEESRSRNFFAFSSSESLPVIFSTSEINRLEFFTSSNFVSFAKIIDEFKPDVVIGTGGYICGPVFHVALKRKIPTVLHESNAFPGKAVKHFSKRVDKILVGFEETKSKLDGAKSVVVTGTPTKIRKLDIKKKKENPAAYCDGFFLNRRDFTLLRTRIGNYIVTIGYYYYVAEI